MKAKKTKTKTRHPGLYRVKGGRKTDHYWLRVTVVDARTGTRSYKTRSLPPGLTAAEALQELSNLKAAVRLGPARLGAPRRALSVADYAVQWIESKAARLRRGTVDRYVYALELHILPRLGGIRIAGLLRTDVEDWVTWSETATDGNGVAYSRETVQGWWRVLCALLRDAAVDHNIADPTVRVQGPRIHGRAPKREQCTLTLDELADLLEGMLGVAPHRYLEVYTLAWTGMRPGELFALTWGALDLRRGTMVLRVSVSRGKVSAPKTGVARTVPITKEHCQLLDSHRRHQIAVQHPGLELGLVFPSDVGRHRPVSSLQKPLKNAARLAELTTHVTPQVLRRTFNMLAVRAGVDRIVLRSMIGHVDERMTERYSGVDNEDKISAIQKLKKGGE